MEYRVTPVVVGQGAFGAGISTRLFNGGEHDLATISLMLSEIQPGNGPRLHRHDYEEVFVVHEGQGSFVIGETTVEAGAGDIVVVPAGLPHRFVSIGAGSLRVTAVHATSKIAIEWLE